MIRPPRRLLNSFGKRTASEFCRRFCVNQANEDNIETHFWKATSINSMNTYYLFTARKRIKRNAKSANGSGSKLARRVDSRPAIDPKHSAELLVGARHGLAGFL